MTDNTGTAVPRLEREADGKVFMLSERLTTFGASSRCSIVLSGEGVPMNIAHIVFSGGTWSVAAINRTVPVYLNQEPLDKAVPLRDGDTITIVHEVWVFRNSYSEKQVQGSSGEASALRRFIGALSRFTRTGDSDTRFELLAGIAQLLLADGARLVTEDTPGNYTTIARYPISSGLDRFSLRAIEWAKEKASTVVMHETDWAASSDSKGSLELNRIGSVMCGLVHEGDTVKGYLYVDRCDERVLFTEEDRQMLDDVIPVFGDLLVLYERTNRQYETIERLQRGIEEKRNPIVYECDSMRACIATAARFGATDATVLVTGETGTGKELVARFIHQHSNRASREFCAINCGALPENLIESELFGHEKGAFTGAHQRKKGLFERASGGTVFLDEIGEVPLNLQVKLLRVLQEGEVLPLGANETIKIDVRVIAATNRTLQSEVSNGRFREDLFYRLNVLEVMLPPLRNRNRDVLLLAEYYISKYAARFGIQEKGISLPAQATLLGYVWPGNIRQLENVVQKALLISKSPLLLATDFDLPQLQDGSAGVDGSAHPEKPLISLKDAKNSAEKQCITLALKRSGGNVSVAARLLETDRKWLTKLMKLHGIQGGETGSSG